MAERTGCPILSSLWSYVTVIVLKIFMFQVQGRSKINRAGGQKRQTYNSRYSLVASYVFHSCPSGLPQLDHLYLFQLSLDIIASLD